MRDPRTVLYLGRFNPFHLGHLDTVKYLEQKYSRVIVAIGSAQDSHTEKNPFTAGERYDMIRRSLADENLSHVEVISVVDVGNNSQWVAFVESQLPRFHVVIGNNGLVEVLFRERGYNVEYTPLGGGNRDLYQGTFVRRCIAAGPLKYGEDDVRWESLVPDGTVQVIKAVDGESRLRGITHGDKFAQTS